MCQELTNRSLGWIFSIDAENFSEILVPIFQTVAPSNNEVKQSQAAKHKATVAKQEYLREGLR